MGFLFCGTHCIDIIDLQGGVYMYHLMLSFMRFLIVRQRK